MLPGRFAEINKTIFLYSIVFFFFLIYQKVLQYNIIKVSILLWNIWGAILFSKNKNM